MATREQVLAWLDERGWPHDPRELTKEQDLELRGTLRICGHRNRRHEPCAFPPMANGRCKRANGKARKGIAHPNYQNKGRSRYLPPGRIRDRYKELDAAGLLDLTHERKLMAIREEELVRRVDPGETGKTWKALRQEWAGLQAALREAQRNPEDPEAAGKVQERVMAISALIGRGASDSEAWDELLKLWDLGRKIVDTEVKRRVMWRLFIKAEDATQDYDAVANAVRDTVDAFVARGKLDRSTADRLLVETSERFAKLVAIPGLPAPKK